MRRLVALAVSLFALNQPGAVAQQNEVPAQLLVPVVPLHGSPVRESLPRLLAEDWQIAAASLQGRTFAYHLVKQGVLIVCLTQLERVPPGSQCIRLNDGPMPVINGTPQP
ncbi:hypothetical protein [Falsiroseomonas tokyonensis]|uniref:Uncharacterized protein n=1 Tax=Falsiroseomonas tokyonensis TaxID=430521 RepID=A0ABV7C5W2_9PROT|nr:hypothetical protein [Falsiroseomonas tokyonensis]MBU8541822.1 hypothetical protein [Falsiroseomonas tokyonensis]